MNGTAPDFYGGGAACTTPTVDPDQFHPIGVDTKAIRDAADATIARYCQRCPMQAECLAWGIRHGQRTGIWGGVWFDRNRPTTRVARRVAV